MPITDNEIDQLLGTEQGQGQAEAVFSLDDNADDAARAMQLGSATGTNPSLIYPDVKAWETQQKANVTKALFDENEFLREYAAKNPLSAKVSNDDWGQLDNFTDLLGKVPVPFPGGLNVEQHASIAKKELSAFLEAFNFEQQNVEYAKLGEYLKTAHPIFSNSIIRYATQAAGGTAAMGLYGMTGALAAVSAGATEALKLQGLAKLPWVHSDLSPDAAAARLTRDLFAGAQVAMPELVTEGAAAMAANQARAVTQARILDNVARPYIEAGQSPPVGLHPVIDQLHAEQAATDLKALQDALAGAIESNTRERSPPAFADLARQVTDGDIGVSADAIRALYGDKVPAPDDGILGWVPRLQEQLQAAAPTGGDVQIPIADWLARVEPQVAKALEEAIRVRPEGMTVAEGKELPATIPIEGGPIEVAREAAALHPLQPDPTLAAAAAEKFGPNLPLDQREAFSKASAIGMTVEQYKLYQARISEQIAGDQAAILKKALAEEKRRQSKDWKDKAHAMRPEVVDDLRTEPAFAADRLIREGRYANIDLGPQKIAEDALTTEQKAILPKSYYAKKGTSPAELAEVVGAQSADAFINDLVAFVQGRKTSGMRADDYTRRLVDAEIERRMEATYGKFEESVLEMVKERVLAQTQVEILHQEVLAAATKAGLQYTMTPEQVITAIRGVFDELRVKEVSSDKFLAEAGRVGRQANVLDLKGKFAEALRERERQYFAIVKAKMAKELEAELVALDKTAKPYQRRDVQRIDPATRYYVQGLLQEAGYNVRMLPEEIANEIAAYGHGTLGEFAVSKLRDGYEPTIADWIMNEGPRELKTLTAKEAMEFKDAIDTLDFIGRAVNKINLAGDAADFAKWKYEEVLPNITARPIRPLKEGPGHTREGNWLYGIDAPMLRIEEIVRALDLRKELGPLFKGLIVPMEMGKAQSYKLLTELSKSLSSMDKVLGNKWYKTLGDNIPNDFIVDTYNNSAVLFDLTRWNMVRMMLNWGNIQNAAKLVDGIARAQLPVGIKPAPEHLAMIEGRIQQMFQAHAKPEDWKFVKHIWDQFDSYRPAIEKLQRSMSGKPPKWVVGRPVQTPFGVIEGKYFPLILDKARNVGRYLKVEDSIEGILGRDYHRATTNQYHLEERTGAKYFVDITNGPEQLVGRLQQVIHDLSFREAVVNGWKIIKDPEISAAIKKHYGVEYYRQLQPWLERIARANNADEGWLAGANTILGRARTNLVMSALPLNPSIMLTPSLGTGNPKIVWNALKSMSTWVTGGTHEVAAVVNAHSKEVPNLLFSLDRDAAEAMMRVQGRKNLTSYQKTAMEWFLKPLVWMEQQTRMTTFYDEFMTQKTKGKTDFEAAAWADSRVRQQHGISHFADLSNLMASRNEFVRVPTMFMGYFSTIYNWAHEIPDLVRQGRKVDLAKTLWGVFGIAAIYNTLIFTKQRQDEPWYKFMAKALLTTPFSMIPYVREGWGYYTEGYQPRSPALSMIQAGGNVIRDGINVAQGKQPKRPVRNAFELVGQGLGVPGALQMGRVGEFTHDVATGEQRPRNIIEWSRGLLWGDSQLKR